MPATFAQSRRVENEKASFGVAPSFLKSSNLIRTKGGLKDSVRTNRGRIKKQKRGRSYIRGKKRRLNFRAAGTGALSFEWSLG